MFWNLFFQFCCFQRSLRTPEPYKVSLQTYFFTDLYFSLYPFLWSIYFYCGICKSNPGKPLKLWNWDLHIYKVKPNEKYHLIFLILFLFFIYCLCFSTNAYGSPAKWCGGKQTVCSRIMGRHL